MTGKLRSPILVLALLVTLLIGACAGPAAPASEAEVEAAANAGPSDGASAENVPSYAAWDDVLAAAQGTTVNWFLWGGSETINNHVDTAIGEPLLEQYGITLNRVPVENTADAINKVLNEKAAGRDSGGSIDLIWINGENFRTLKEAGLLYGPFVDLLPNTALVDWENPAVAYDFGVAVDGYESPWASFQWVLEYNAATVGENPPTSFEALRDWIEANPGRFTYPALPNHVGAAFVRQLFYWAAGSPEPFLGGFDQAVFDETAPIVWEYLNGIEPYLWREGQTYPELPIMTDLLANQEIDFNMEYDSSRASTYIREGIYPDTIRTTVLDGGTLANVSYVAIPYNANNPAGALVLANFLLSPGYQMAITDPDVLGWKMAIDPTRLSEEDRTALAAMPRGSATLAADVLSGAALPEMSVDWVAAIEQGWEENVLQR
jgi:putative spermidine/putrescine transport system substrate-binding protein